MEVILRANAVQKKSGVPGRASHQTGRRRVVCAFVLLGCSAISGGASQKDRGPFKPVIAKQKLFYIAEENGAQKLLYEFTGEYLRSADGSELATLGLTVNGKAGSPSEARLRLGRDGTTYKLDYVRHTATLMATQPLPLAPHSYGQLNREDIAGHANLNGMHCTGITLHDHGDETGTAWRELKSDILVRLVSYFGSKEDHVLVILERYDISTRQEPDESLFAIPEKWMVITPASPAPAPAKPTPRQ